MKLWFSPASPFVRKVMITAHETGQANAITKVDANTTVINRNLELVKDNPSGRIPVMVLDDGTVLFDSRVICAFLDSRHDGPKLIPQSGLERFKVMTLEALGDGLMDAAVAARYEIGLRPAEKQWDKWKAGLLDKVRSSLDDLEANRLPQLSGPLNAGAISVAAGLGYLDFRFSDMGWRDSRPGLAAWSVEFSKRPSMQATMPG
jgi:glutathione S-transferase